MEKKPIRDMGHDTIEQFNTRTKIPDTVVLDHISYHNYFCSHIISFVTYATI